MKKRVFIMAIVVIFMIAPPAFAYSNFSLNVGINAYSRSGLVETIFPHSSNRPKWLKSTIAEAFVPDFLETQIILTEKYLFQFGIGTVQPIWFDHTGLRVGIKRKLNIPVISHVTLGYSQFLRKKGGSTLDVRFNGYYRSILGEWLNMEPELNVGASVYGRSNKGSVQLFDYIRLPVNISFNKMNIPVGISVGTFMVCTFGGNGKTGFVLLPDFYIAIKFGSFL